MKTCTVSRCAYTSIWSLSCRAYDEHGSMRVNLKRQHFCFWHYAALGLHKLHVGDFRDFRGAGHDDLVVKAL